MVHGFTCNGIGSVQEEYKGYLQQAESLPREMRRRGISSVNARFIETNFKVYADGTVEVPMRTQPVLARIGLTQKSTKRIGLENFGEMLYHLTATERRYEEEPRHLDQIAPADLKRLASALSLSCMDFVTNRNPIEGL